MPSDLLLPIASVLIPVVESTCLNDPQLTYFCNCQWRSGTESFSLFLHSSKRRSLFKMTNVRKTRKDAIGKSFQLSNGYVFLLVNTCSICRNLAFILQVKMRLQTTRIFKSGNFSTKTFSQFLISQSTM